MPNNVFFIVFRFCISFCCDFLERNTNLITYIHYSIQKRIASYNFNYSKVFFETLTEISDVMAE